MTRIDLWNKEEHFKEFEALLKHPLMVEALAILEDKAKPDTDVASHITMGASAIDAAHRVAALHHNKAGIQSAVNTFRSLGRIPSNREKTQMPEPFHHITEKYLEKS